MYIACHWGRFRGFLNIESDSTSEAEQTRRRLLQAGAVFAAGGNDRHERPSQARVARHE